MNNQKNALQILKDWGISLKHLKEKEYLSKTVYNNLNKGFSKSESNKAYYVKESHIDALKKAVSGYIIDLNKFRSNELKELNLGN